MSIDTGIRVGSLFSGYGGLDIGVTSVLGGRVVWHSDIDPGPCKLLEHRWPGVPNLGDISAVDFADVEPIDVLTGGFPCQDLSMAGRRAGLKPGTRSGLWSEMHRAIQVLRPRLVIAENVRGLLSARAHAADDLESCPFCVGDDEDSPLRALGAVLGDLADIGYDARWYGLRAADAGAPHGRFRVFIFAWPRDAAADATGGESGGRGGRREVGGETPAGAGEAGERQWDRDTTGGRSSETSHPDDGGRPAGDQRGRARTGTGADAARDGGADPDADDDGPGDRRTGTRRGPVAVDGVRDGAAENPDVPAGGERGIAAPGQAQGRRARPDAGRRGGAPAADADRERLEHPDDGVAPRARADATAGRPGAAPTGDGVAAADAGRGGLERLGGTGHVAGPAAAPGGDHGPGEQPDAGDGGAAGGRGRGAAPAGHADAAADPEGVRRGEGRPEPAGVVGRPHAAVGDGGAGPVPDAGRVGGERRRGTGDVDGPAGPDAGGGRGGHGDAAGDGGQGDRRRRDAAADPDGVGAAGGREHGPAQPAAAGRPADRGADAAADTGGDGREGRPVVDGAPTGGRGPVEHVGHAAGRDVEAGGAPAAAVAWGAYEPAIRRWELIVDRDAPPPTEPGRNGAPRLSPRFVEWLMGLPAGHVTAVPGLSRNEQLKLLGNGVVPQQAALAVATFVRESSGMA